MDVSNIRVVLTGGSNAEPDLVERLHQAYPDSTIMNLYGLSESSGGAIMTPLELPLHHGGAAPSASPSPDLTS